MSRLRRPSGAFVIACAALFVSLGGGAYAATSLPSGSVGHNKLKNNSVWHNDIGTGSVQFNNLSSSVIGELTKSGKPGATGPAGSTGPAGPAGPTGFEGSFYSVEDYTGTVGVGAIATAACDPNDATNSQKYVAISGGVQDTDSSSDMTTNDNQVEVAASFPGRMDFSTNTPKPGRLDGWIVQFGHSGGQDNNLAVWALCVPVADDGGNVPVVTNSTTTG